MGCSIGVNGKYKVGYLKHRMMLTDATGDAQGMIWDGVNLVIMSPETAVDY